MEFKTNTANIGLNTDSTSIQLKEGQLTYANNATVESFDGNILTYSNETGNDLCVTFPENYKVIGVKNIQSLKRNLFWLVNNLTNDSEIGYVEHNSCEYISLIKDKDQECKLNFSLDYPIYKAVIKDTNCSTQIYWTDRLNPRRFLDFDNLPWKEEIDPSNDYKRIKLEGQLDCNKLNVQPDFSIPELEVKEVLTGGDLLMGTYQFAIQYSNELGEGYTSYYNVTNPIGIFENKISPDFNLPTSKAISIDITNLDTTGLYEYFNIAVIKTVNLITTVELVGTFAIASSIVDPVTKTSKYNYVYTGSEKSNPQLLIEDIFEQFPYYDIAEDVTSVDNTLLWGGLKTDDEVNYQQIWSKVKLYWETAKIPYNQFEGYNSGENTANYKSYMRDEVYPFEGYFILKNGKKVKACHIPGRTATAFDRELIDTSNKDNAFSTINSCDDPIIKERWQVYNTGSRIDYTEEYKTYLQNNPPKIITTPIGGDVIEGNIHVGCDNGGAGISQGCATLTITFTNPTPASGITLQIGMVDRIGSMGFDMGYTPTGATQNFYGSAPFTINIPGGVTTFSIPKCTISNGTNTWVCLPTKNYIYTLYFKVLCHTAKFTVTSFQTTPITVHNIKDNCGTITTTIQEDCYIGPYEYGEFAFWESEETYPNNQLIWGDLAGKKIKHHKFPDQLVTAIHSQNEAIDEYQNFEYSIFPIGVKVDMNSLYDAIQNSNLTQEQKDQIVGFKIVRGNRTTNKSVIAKGILHNVGKSTYDDKDYYYANYPYNDLSKDKYFFNKEFNRKTISTNPFISGIVADDGTQLPLSYSNNYNNSLLDGFNNTDANTRYVFHSPDTHFYQPSLSNEGSYLKLDSIIYGKSYGHFVKVEDNAEYKFLTRDSLIASAGAALGAGLTIGAGQFGSPTFSIDKAAATYTAWNDIFDKITPYENFGYTYHSVGIYGNYFPIPNDQYKQRSIDKLRYVTDGSNAIEEGNTLNNFRRESSVYIHTTDNLKFTTEYDSSIPIDNSRYTLASIGDNQSPETIRETDISSYYGAIKRDLPRQWGRMYSYESIDTGYYQDLYDEYNNKVSKFKTVFGGDIFINRFAYKSKMPFFRRNTVKDVNGADIAYNELGNINYPVFWLSTKPIDFDVDVQNEVDAIVDELTDTKIWNILRNVISAGARPVKLANDLIIKLLKEIYNKVGIKNINLDGWDLQGGQSYGLNERGLIYLFSYGIPYYFCESEVNVDYRQAYNELEGNFYPNVSSEIPDNWLQEINVPIINDNTYTYNKTYSKQNKESFIDHLKENFDPNKKCFTEFPNRVIWSDKSNVEETKNNWLIYRAAARKDLSKSNGDFIAIDSLQNNQILTRFTNKSQIFNALTTVNVSEGPKAFLGNDTLFSAPPIDLSETDIGNAGSQHKFLLKTEFGNMFVDAQRAQIILLHQNGIEDLATKGMDKWFTENLPFKILEYDKDFPIDNNFNGVGLHGVYDGFYQRIILTKLDYIPKDNVQLINGSAYYDNGSELISIAVGNPEYFIDKSWSISYNFKTQSWISFHSYHPNYYIQYSNSFQTGRNDLESLWDHNKTFTKFNNYYGENYPYILEYPFVYKFQDEILQSVKDYCSARVYTDFDIYYEPDETIYFNKCVIYNSQENSGLLNLIPKPKNSLKSYISYPKYNNDSKDILVTKSDNFYNYNTFWDITKNKSVSSWVTTEDSKYGNKTLNTPNLDYNLKSHKKYQIRGKDVKIRAILDNRNDIKLISKFITTETSPSYK